MSRAQLNKIILPIITFIVVISIWNAISDMEASFLPTPLQTLMKNWEIISHPFFDHGPNSKGIGWHLFVSLGRVAIGFGLAAFIGIPIGFLVGSSPQFQAALNPLIQILRPVSPLAWLPLGLATFKAAGLAATFVIFITAIWPILINTAFGTAHINADYLAMARILKLSRWQTLWKILFPATLPYIFTGLKISLGVAWLVIVAVEMLTGGAGIGFFIWDEWNNLNLEHIILAIMIIGGTGLFLDFLISVIAQRYDYIA